MSTSSVARFGGLGVSTDVIRSFNRAIELVASNSAESENELLDLVKKAKREAEKEPHPSKKSRSGRVTGEPSELQPLPYKTPMVPISQEHLPFLLLGEQTSSQPASSWSDAGSGTTSSVGSTTGGNGSMTQAQARLMNVIRGGPGRGRIEKPKRKATR
ncbi:unnamed protein product [Calypogeia fissa]